MKALLTKIQAEYEAMPRSLESRLRSLPSGELDPEAIEEMQQLKRTKNRILGVVKLIGELFQRKILGFPIVRDVVVDLVIKNEEPDEHFIECFVQLIATTGYYIDQNPKVKAVLDSWFGRLTELQKKPCYSKRLKCIIQDTLDMRKAEWRKKIHKERAKALSDLREQLETEEVLGGSVHAAQYGNIVVVGQRSNLNGAYAGYLKEQQETFDRKVAKLRPPAGAPPVGPGASSGANPVRR
ncbi:putative eukaryotic translation initiation factor [Toxoplasma gondii RUB]|nr:putative eukaryotic translation initiation factor [Toxoplasma gondii RUB]